MSLKRVAGMLIILAAGIYLAVYITFLSIPAADVFSDVIPEVQVYKGNEAEENIYAFICRNLVSEDGGILTNIKNCTGCRDTLAESVGLMMNYCLLSDNRTQYHDQFNFLKNKLIEDNMFIKWRTGENTASCNAAIDDLRIIRALMDGYDMWHDEDYYNLAGNLQYNMYKYQVSDRSLYEFFDWTNGRSGSTVPLCYFDLYTMDRLSEFNAGWLAVEESSLSIISDGRIGSSPFFYKYFDHDTATYGFDEEYAKQKGICLTYTLYTVIHLIEVNEDTDFFTLWLKDEMKDGRLYSWYNPGSLKPVNNIESTAVYALAAIYADKAGEKQLYKKLIEGMKKFMVTDKKSPYYGGFGMPADKSFHSFDNLTALWAVTMSGGN